MAATQTGRWLAGWNMPGYMPETPWESFESEDAAEAYIQEALARHHDEDCQMCDLDEDMTPLREMFDQAVDDLASHGTCSYGSYTYYVEAEEE